MRTRSLILAAGLAVAIGLGGCISLFPKSDPSTLYKLSATVAAAPATGAAATTVLRAPTAFTRVAASDRILTTTGAETAFIAKARWAAPVSVMFDEALANAFTAAAPGVRLATRGDVAAADRVLRVEVRTFEAQYRAGQGSAPTVVVEARATLNGLRGEGAAERIFTAEQTAGDNRVGPIVDAYNLATSKVVGDIATWTASQAKKP